MSDDNLPPLPEPDKRESRYCNKCGYMGCEQEHPRGGTTTGERCYYFASIVAGPWFTIDQMRAYARAALAAQPAVIYSPLETSPHAEKDGKHQNDHEPKDPARWPYLVERGDDEGQGLSAYWKWGHAAGWNDHKRHVAPQPPAQPPQAGELTDEQIRELVKESGLDWHRGFAPLFDGDETNRYAVLVRAAIAAVKDPS